MAPNRSTHKHRRSALSSLMDRVLIIATAIVVFALPLFMWPALTDNGYGKCIASLVAISILSILCGIAGWMRGNWKIRWPWITVPFLGFVIASLL